MTISEALQIAVQHQRAGRLAEAAELCRQILADEPSVAVVWNLLAVIRFDAGQWASALEFARRAVALEPREAQLHCTLGFIFNGMNQPAEALNACSQAIRLKHDCAAAYFGIAKARTLQGRVGEAIDAYREALRCKPDYADAASNLGVLLKEQGDFDAAFSAYHQALQANPNHAASHNNLGDALREIGRLDEAVVSFQTAMRLNPTFSLAHSNLILAQLHASGVTTAMINTECREWWLRHGLPLMPGGLQHSRDESPERRLRLGYVSTDFCDHPVARHILPLLCNHDTERFEVVCYSGVARADAMTERFCALELQWRDTANLSNDQLAVQIREDRIDILIDLSLHTRGNRLLVFARHPAPVQVSFAGYPGTSGLESIAYRLTDRFLEPEAGNEGGMVEQPIRLPGSFWCYDPCEAGLEVNGSPAVESGTVTFGCLNSVYKVNETALGLWARVLGEISDSRLVLLARTRSQRERTLEILEGKGIEACRVEFVEFRPRREYLELYHRLDMILDTFPYNGHMTSLDALWMGVPVVSLSGETPVSRGGLSQLTNLGLPELVARSDDEYVRIAIELVRDVPRLARLRLSLRHRMKSSVLMDAPRFARAVEQAYREMWQTWSAGNPSIRQDL